jgi:hypothetical protein
VCKSWFAASNYQKFLDEIEVTMKDSKTTLQLFTNSTRKLSNFYFEEHNMNTREHKQLWTKIAPNIKSLALHASFAKPEIFVDFFTTAPQLSSVRLYLMPRYITEDWRLKHFSEIKANNCVKHFRWIDEASFIPDKLLIGFMQAFTDLESVMLGAKPVLETMTDEDFIVMNSQRHVCMECVHEEAREDTVVRFLQKNAKSLKELTLDEQKNWR